MSSDTLLRPAQVIHLLNISRTTLWRLSENDPSFPRKIKLSKRVVGYKKSSLDAYLAKKEAEA